MSSSHTLSRLTLTLALSACTLGSAWAQRVVHLVVPFGPGAVQDTLARTFHNELGQALGATVLVVGSAAHDASGGSRAAQTMPLKLLLNSKLPPKNAL